MRLEELHRDAIKRKTSEKGRRLEDYFDGREDETDDLENETQVSTQLSQLNKSGTMPDTSSASDTRGYGRQI